MNPTQKQLVHDLAVLMNDVPNHRRVAVTPALERLLAHVELKLRDCPYLVERRPLALMKRHLDVAKPASPRNIFFQLYDEHTDTCHAEGFTTLEELAALLKYAPRTMQNYLYQAKKGKRNYANEWPFQYGKPVRDWFRVYAVFAMRQARETDLTLAQGLAQLPMTKFNTGVKAAGKPHRSQDG